MKNNVKQLVIMSLLVAILLVFAFTGIGYIRLGVAAITLMCIPVVVGTLILGLVPGLILGLIFALTSIYQLLMAPTGLFGLIYTMDGLWPLIAVLLIPRLLVPTFTHLFAKLLKKAKPAVKYGAAAFVGSVTNTVFVLGMTYLLYLPTIEGIFNEIMGMPALAGIGMITLTNGLPEGAAAIVICVPVMMALKKAVPSAFKLNKNA